MRKRTKDDFIPTPERKEFYKFLSKWLSENNIPFKKLTVGLCVNIASIPNDKVEFWIKNSDFDNWKTLNN